MKVGINYSPVTITFETLEEWKVFKNFLHETIVDIEDKQLSFFTRTKRHHSAQEQEMLGMCTKILKATNYMEIK